MLTMGDMPSSLGAFDWPVGLRFVVALALGFLVGLEREAGVILSPSTFNAGVMRCGELLMPLSGAMREAVTHGLCDEIRLGMNHGLKPGFDCGFQRSF